MFPRPDKENTNICKKREAEGSHVDVEAQTGVSGPGRSRRGRLRRGDGAQLQDDAGRGQRADALGDRCRRHAVQPSADQVARRADLCQKTSIALSLPVLNP
jgi:hypothetical protein